MTFHRVFDQNSERGLDARAPDATRVTDKMPFNMLWLGLIALILPNARVIYCRRNPMDNALSCYFQLFSRGLRFAYDLGDVGHVYRQHERLMAHWQTHLPLSMLTVDYEALVSDPETLVVNITVPAVADLGESDEAEGEEAAEGEAGAEAEAAGDSE